MTYPHLADDYLAFLQWAECETACQLMAEFPDMQQLLNKFQENLNHMNWKISEIQIDEIRILFTQTALHFAQMPGNKCTAINAVQQMFWNK